MDHKFTVRNCDPLNGRDCSAYERLKPGAVFSDLLNKPGYRVSEALFFAEADGGVVGYVNVLPELGIGRVVLDYSVGLPRSLGPALTQLLDHALEQARKLGAEKAHATIPSAGSARAEWLSELLSNLGFTEVCRYYELRLDFSEVNLEATYWLDSVYRHFLPGEEEMLAEIQNRCFAGAWGYNPNTAEDISWRLRVKGNSPDDVIFAWDGSELIGYCWTVANCGRDLSTGRSKGRVHMLGVDPDHRNSGLGEELLLTGLWHLKRNGQEIIDVTVSSHNDVAVGLYLRVGFQLIEETLWYEKIMD